MRIMKGYLLFVKRVYVKNLVISNCSRERPSFGLSEYICDCWDGKKKVQRFCHILLFNSKATQINTIFGLKWHKLINHSIH